MMGSGIRSLTSSPTPAGGRCSLRIERPNLRLRRQLPRRAAVGCGVLFAFLGLHQRILLEDVAERPPTLWSEIQPHKIPTTLALRDILYLRGSATQRTCQNHHVVSTPEWRSIDLATDGPDPRPACEHPQEVAKASGRNNCENEKRPSLPVQCDADEPHTIGRNHQRNGV